MSKITDEEQQVLTGLYNDIIDDVLLAFYKDVSYSKTMEGKCMILKFWVKKDTQEKAPNEQK